MMIQHCPLFTGCMTGWVQTLTPSLSGSFSIMDQGFHFYCVSAVKANLSRRKIFGDRCPTADGVFAVGSDLFQDDSMLEQVRFPEPGLDLFFFPEHVPQDQVVTFLLDHVDIFHEEFFLALSNQIQVGVAHIFILSKTAFDDLVLLHFIGCKGFECSFMNYSSSVFSISLEPWNPGPLRPLSLTP